jgi:uncharacterized protein (TIGR02722 family)
MSRTVVRRRALAPSLFVLLLLVSLASGPVGCASRSVARTETDEAIDLSGYWNDTDSRLVSEEMIRDCTSRPWAGDFRQENGEKPRVIVGSVRNLSMEHLNTSTFVKDLEKELINSGQVRFVATKGQREELRSERRDQDQHASVETHKNRGQERAADFILIAQIDQINDSVEGKQVKYYQIELELVDIESNEKVWIGQKKIKKLVKQRGVKF